MKAASRSVEDSAIRQQCKLRRLPTVGGQFRSLAEQAVREKRSHTGYLEALLQAEVEERERNTIQRRLQEARLPRMKTLENFDFSQASRVSATEIRQLAEGGYIDGAEPILFLGIPGRARPI